MERLSIGVLGEFTVKADGTPVVETAWRSRRASDLVKILALTPAHELHREQLIELLWPTLGADAGAANLRKAIHLARRAMGGPGAIRSRANSVALGDCWIDLDAFLATARAAERSGERGAYEAAADLYAGDVLPGDRYEEWSEPARTLAAERFIDVLRGAERWERVVELDPIDEEAQRALMRRHLEAGRRSDALRQFERFRVALREFVGVSPDQETVALYERLLAVDGAAPPSPSQRAASLIANALVQLNRGEIEEAERLAREAKSIAIDAELVDEMGDASTLLGIVAFQTGRWHDVFREEFVASLDQRPGLAYAVQEAHLCFLEYYVCAVDTNAVTEQRARELLALATARGSDPGRGTALLMLGDSYLLRGDFDRAHRELERAVSFYRRPDTPGGFAIAVERLATADLALGRREAAKALVAEARPAALRSGLRSHTVVRLLGVEVGAADDADEAVATVRRAEQHLGELRRVCDPCGVDYHIQATIACARGRDLPRARRHLDDAERVSGMWNRGPWTAAVWEARAALRLAEGKADQASALFKEAAAEFAAAQRPIDMERCLQSAVA